MMWIGTFRLHTTSLHQVMRSTAYAKPYKAQCSSTAVIGVFWSSLVRWAVLLAVRYFCSSPVVVFLDCGHPCFRNFSSTISDDVVRVKCYVNHLFDPACVPIQITVNKLYLISKRECPVLWVCSETAVTGKLDASVVLLYPVLHRSSSLADVSGWPVPLITRSTCSELWHRFRSMWLQAWLISLFLPQSVNLAL